MKTSLVGRTLIILFLTTLILSICTGLVQAQATTVVRIDPPSADIQPGESFTVNLEVLGGEQVNAYDVTITYDPAVIELKSWAQGGYLSNTAQVYKVNEPGRLQLVYTQLARPAVSGDGVLLSLTFTGLTAGMSPITIEKLEFADSAGNLTNPQLQSGNLTVQAMPSPTPTPTESPTSTIPAVPNTATPPGPTQTVQARVTILPSNAPTLTVPAVQPGQTVTAVAGQPTAELIVETAASSSSNIYLPAMQNAEGQAPVQADEPNYQSTNLILWTVLGVLVVLLFVLIVLVIQRKRAGKSS